MTCLSVHPAAIRLLRYQTTAHLTKLLRGFQGRRLVLSLLSLFLAVVWVGQASLSLLFRQPANLDRLQVWIPLGLMAYGAWHLLKTACKTPVEPFEWTEAERELLGGAPLRRDEMVTYRLLAIGIAALAKAACFCLLMSPDLPVWPAGLTGMFLALLFVDLLRMSIEIYAYGVPRRAFLCFRMAVLAVASACILSAAISTLSQTFFGAPGQIGPWRFIHQFLISLLELRTTWVGVLAQRPFEVFSQAILAPAVSLTLVAQILLAVCLVIVMLHVVVRLDEHMYRKRIDAERKRCRQLNVDEGPCLEPADRGARAVRIPRRWAGAGPLAWRQLLGAWNYRTPVFLALVIPAVLSCLSMLAPQSRLSMLAEIVGGLIFYSFLLLPPALRFDFRRDVDRLAVIKSLPISPLAITLGQLAAPVMIMTLFHLSVLLVAMAIRPFHPTCLAIAIFMLLPVNVLIFSLENLIFMLYPYRVNQEGFGVFLRSVLTFTGKGILFGLGLTATLSWAIVSRHVGPQLVTGEDWRGTAAVFLIGMWLLISGLTVFTTLLLVRVFQRFDPSADTPAMS